MSNDNDVYNKLSVANENDKNQKMNIFLFTCCLVASLASFAFGFNIGVTNLPTPRVKDFYARKYGAELFAGKENFTVSMQQWKAGDALWAENNKNYTINLEKYNASEVEYAKGVAGLAQMKAANDPKKEGSIQQLEATLKVNRAKLDAAKAELTVGEAKLNGSRTFLDEKKALLDAGEKKIIAGQTKLDGLNTMLWTLTNVVFVIGGVIGAFTSKYVAEGFGRKKAIVFHYIFGVVAAVLTLIAPYINSPECVIVGRFLFGVQGGMTCGLVPGYLNEISPNKLRGATGVMQQLMITCGILVSQVLGIRQLLGTDQHWHILLALSAVPSIIGGVVLLIFFPDSPSSLMNRDRDEDGARRALERLRQSKNVSNEIDDIKAESRESKSDRSLTISELFTTPELRWPLITSVVLQLTQQFCGINAIFFYSESIFKGAGIAAEYIQYAVLATGAINVLATIIALPLIDRLGRKPLLVYPLLFIVVDFIALTFFLIFKQTSVIFSYLSIVAIVLFIVSFAVGLGPIPFVYVAECFRAEARSTALAVAMFSNWVANLILTLVFPYMAKLLGDYTFLVFVAVVAIAVTVIIRKVPETKGRNVDEIMAQFDHRAANSFEEAGGKLMSNTNV